MRGLVVWTLVAAGLALSLLSCLGVALMRDALDRVHYAGPASVGAACLALAVLVQGGWSLIGVRALLVAAFLLVASPVLTHAIARATHAGADGGR
jgi:multicomponent Na+:H+ antiporter subunit G